jgi:hypothetical protein
MGEASKDALRVSFDQVINLGEYGSKVTFEYRNLRFGSESNCL